MAGTPARHPADISDEPLINAVHRRLPEMLVVAYILLIVYCCMVPFDFGPPNRKGLGPTIYGLHLRPISLSDILFNIAAYAPIGSGLFLVFRRRGRGRLVAAMIAGGAGFLLSLFIEEVQVFDRMRVPSWIDVISNTLGGGVGIVGGLVLECPIRGLAARARQSAARNWWLSVANVFVCVLLAIQLRPFDLSFDLKHAAKIAIREGRLNPVARWNEIPNQLSAAVEKQEQTFLSLRRNQCEYILDRLADVALYAAATALLIVGMARAGFATRTSYLSAALAVITVGGIVTVIRIFLISRGLDTATLACTLPGIAIGGWTASYALRIHRTRIATARASAITFEWPRRVCLTAVLLTVGMTLAYGLVPFDVRFDTNLSQAFGERGCLMPFRGEFGQRANVAFFGISTQILLFAGVGAALSFLFSVTQHNWRRRTIRVFAATAAVVVAVEFLHLFMPTRHCDVTRLILAMAGTCTGAVALRWAEDYRRITATVAADDLLTSQLIEGPTYEPLPVRSPRSPHAGASPSSREQSNP